MSRYIRAMAGFFLFTLYSRKFDIRILDNQRVAIIGPADSVAGLGKGDYIDGFDIVIRINKSAIIVGKGLQSNDIGTKLDVLFHCFYENLYSGGGPLDLGLFDKLGVKYLVNPRSTFDGLRTTFNFYKSYLQPRRTHYLPRRYYAQLEQGFGKYRPTTGFAALYMALNAKFRELYISGFTFFRTAYTDGYRDEMKEQQQALNYINRMQIHNPDLEFNRFLFELKKNRHKKITLDPVLSEIVNMQPA